MDIPILSYDAARPHLSWTGAVAALRAGHLLPKAAVGDMLLGPTDETLLSRGTYIPGLGHGVKSVTVFDANPRRGRPSIQGVMIVFHPEHGGVEAIIDSRLVTEIKTAADSVLGAQILARPDSRHLLILGAGAVAESLVQAYHALFPKLDRVTIWARRLAQAEALAAQLADGPLPVTATQDLEAAARDADIIATATMAQDPVLRRAWVRPGTHVDLIGAYRPDMREADDALIAGGSLYVDSRETTLEVVGELMIPLAAGVITPDDVKGDLYDLVPLGTSARTTPEDITLFKNGGGAHLDLMISRYIVDALR